MNARSIIILLLTLVAIGLAGTIWYTSMGTGHADLASGDAEVSVTATQIFADFDSNEEKANAKYLNKVIEVKGVVGSMTDSPDGGAVVMVKEDGEPFGVSCSFLEKPSLEIGKTAKIRGNCTGFLMDVALSRCIVVK